MSKPSTKLIVFDFDGTLMDSMAGFGEIAAQVITGIFACDHAWARRRYMETSGLPFPYQIEAIYPKDPRNAEAVAEFNRLKLAFYAKCPFYDEVEGVLSELKAAGHRLAVSSNNDRPLLISRLGGLEPLFDRILGFEKDFLKGRAHFDFLERELGSARADIVFVGDSLHDGVTARENGVPFVARTGTFTDDDFLKQGIALARIPDLSGLPAIIRKLGGA